MTITHRVPGRVRVEIAGMRNQPIVAYKCQSSLTGIRGVQEVQCNASTGRALIRYDIRSISEEQVIHQIRNRLASSAYESFSCDARTMVAATTETEVLQTPVRLTSQRANAGQQESFAPNRPAAPQVNPYKLPALASASLLGVLSLKRLLIGRSALAAAPIPFYAAAGLSIAAGYPALRRGLEASIRERRFNPDLWLGLATLSLAALRENLVALSAITVLNLAMYRRHSVLMDSSDTKLDPELEWHSRQMSKFGMWMTPLTLLLTRSPLRSLGVLLAANPRPALLAHKYAWAQAEHEAFEKQLPIPQQCSLSSLATVRTIVFTDGASLVEDGQEWRIQLLQEGLDEEKAITIAASLIQKEEDHPWRNYLVDTAVRNHRTLRTPFNVEHTEDGVRGILNGHETILGTKAYLKQLKVDPTRVLLEERRMRRDGFKTCILVQEGKLLALIGCKQQLSQNWRHHIENLERKGFSLHCLQQDERIPCPMEMMSVHELHTELEKGNTVLLIGKHDLPIKSPHLVTMPVAEISKLDELFSFCNTVNERVHRDLRVVKAWNLVGPGLAFFAPITAPIINLLGDAVGMLLLARQDWQRRARGSEVLKQTRNKSLLTESVHKQNFHAMDREEALKAVGGNLQGLSLDEVDARQKRYGLNVLQAAPPPNPLRVFFNQFKDFSTLVLLGATGLSLFMGERFNALCMGGILAVNALIGTWQELRSVTVLQALRGEEDPQAKTIRNGVERLIPTSQLVPGDVVLLESGDIVPADLHLLDAWNLEVNEAMLTGESLPAAKQAAPIPIETQMADRSNQLYMGTIVTRGRARAVVVATGGETQIGALQSLLHVGEEPPTPLQKRVTQIGKHFVTAAMIAGGIVVAAGLLRGIPPMELLISSVTLVASAIPEGLPLTITIALTAGVMRMAKRKAVVRKLASLESLGRVTVICSDKTGTLTRNEMTVKELATPSQQLHVSGDGYIPEGSFTIVGERENTSPYELSSDIRQLLTIGLLCNNASLERQDSKHIPVGDPTEVALLTVAEKAGLSSHHWKRHREIPFESQTGSMSVVCQQNEIGEQCILLTKGSPEIILRKCTHYLERGQIRPMTEEIRQQAEAHNQRMADQALRVLGFAYRPLDDEEETEAAKDEGLIYAGLMGMMDPPKDEVAASIEEARTLGIKPVMITGDHPLTARAIGTQLGIYQPGDRILTGEEVEQLTPEQLSNVVSNTSVFARVSPEHKLRIVEAYQRNGEIVAMTGDGVNDAPAVRKADVGIAMGSQGTDITKDTAGIVLMEDHFHSIVDGVKEGRKIIGNIRKAIGCLVTGNFAEVLVATTAVVIGLPMPLIPLQILLMNLLTDGLPAIVLATDPKASGNEQRYQDVVDRSLYQTVITRGSVLGLGALAIFAGALASGVSLPLAQTMTFATLVGGQLIQTVSWRRLGSKQSVSLKMDRPLFLAMGASWLALIAAIYLPGLQGVFGTLPLALPHWAAVLAVSGSVTKLSGSLLDRPKKDAIGPVPLPMAA